MWYSLINLEKKLNYRLLLFTYLLNNLEYSKYSEKTQNPDITFENLKLHGEGNLKCFIIKFNPFEIENITHPSDFILRDFETHHWQFKMPHN